MNKKLEGEEANEPLRMMLLGVKSSKVESSKRVRGSTLLLEKLDAMVQVVTEKNIKDMELMNAEARSLVKSSHSNVESSLTLVDSLSKLVSLSGLVPSTLEFFSCTLIDDPQKRTILSALPDDNARLNWIKYLFEREKRTP
ncbi:hypothetical protein HRI_004342900 [Hibiscus trionum]|uniref:Uncharacterized protein n=1 Tax=Hibiscus trionum TaxID=183268 RepID=A0A9W7J4Y3_HIBTR|nr:hypothetical protein HRI_004342900 [Hibiscus trionum]